MTQPQQPVQQELFEELFPDPDLFGDPSLMPEPWSEEVPQSPTKE